MTDRLKIFEQHRPRLFGIAYRMLGQHADAEDVLQDVFLRWHAAGDDIANPEAWLVQVTTRRSIDQLRIARRLRDAYRGPWLPEPIVEDVHATDEPGAELAEDLSLAFLAVLERLTPEERAAFLLREVFDLDYADVAKALDRTQVACRQLVSRGKRRLQESRRRFRVSRAEHLALLERFVRAAQSGDREQLAALFAEDAVYVGDGGGKVAAGSRALQGGRRVAKLWYVLGSRHGAGYTYRVAEINGQPGLLRFWRGELESAIAIDTDGVRICGVLLVRNPDKLARIADRIVTNTTSSASSGVY